MRPLTSNRQIPTVPSASIAPDIHESLHVHRDFRPQSAFHLNIPFDCLPQASYLSVRKIEHARVGIHGCEFQNMARC
jgi:hypothetical protein